MTKEGLKSVVLVSEQELNEVQKAAGSQDLSAFASKAISDALRRKYGPKRRKCRDGLVLSFG